VVPEQRGLAKTRRDREAREGRAGPGCTVETTMRSMRTRIKELSLGT